MKVEDLLRLAEVRGILAGLTFVVEDSGAAEAIQLAIDVLNDIENENKEIIEKNENANDGQ